MPHITYCIELWGNSTKIALKPLELLQKKIVRIITFSNFRCHSTPLFHELKLLNIPSLYKFHICLFVFDLNNNHYAHDIHHYLDPLPHTYPTRLATSSNYYIPKTKLDLSQRGLKFSATKQWNSLPDYIKRTKSRNSLKTKLKHFLLHNQ